MSAAPTPPAALELVVAHYHENLNWLRRVPALITKSVYSKADSPPNVLHLILPNTGREAHTYLYHVVQRYDSLADFTIFCQGKPFDHAYDFHHRLRALVNGAPPRMPFEWLGHIIDTDTADGMLFQKWSKNTTGQGLDLAGFYSALFGTPGPAEYPFVLGAQFVVARELIQRQPRLFYEKALALASDFPHAPHCYERLWDRVWGVTGIDPVWLAGRRTVYLKKIRARPFSE